MCHEIIPWLDKRLVSEDIPLKLRSYAPISMSLSRARTHYPYIGSHSQLKCGYIQQEKTIIPALVALFFSWNTLQGHAKQEKPYSVPLVNQLHHPPCGGTASMPQALATATTTAPNTLMPPRILTSTKLLLLTTSLRLHRPSGSRESSPIALLYLCPGLLAFSSPCRTTAHSALGEPPGEAMIFPLETSSPTRSSSHFALSLRCSSSNLSRSLRRLRCKSVAHFAMRTSVSRCSPCT